MSRQSILLVIKVSLFTVSLLPLACLGWLLYANDLGSDPQLTLLHFTGLWSLRFLLITLCVTPLYRLFGWWYLPRCRRMLGLFALFYAVLHLLIYWLFFLGLDWSQLLEEIVERPYITIGMIALALMASLGLTSPKFMMKQLGRRWKTLHRTIYVIAPLAVWHFYWSVKLDVAEPAFYLCITVFLLILRIPKAKRLLGTG